MPELLLLLMLAAACNHLDPGRLEGERPGTAQRGDTCLFMSAVQVPAGYDWRRNADFGMPGGAVLLFRDFKQILTLSLSKEISPDPDTHHILDGHLYTEYSGSSETVIRRDGVEIARWAGRERLCGILEEDGVYYTLSQNRAGKGFSLRRGGEALMTRVSGQIVGDLLDPSCPPSGALVRDAGELCFFFTDGTNFARTLYQVRGNRIDPLRSVPVGSSLADAKLVGSRAYSLVIGDNGGELWEDGREVLLPDVPGLSWTDVRIYPYAGAYALAGSYLMGGQAGAGVLYPDGRLEALGGPDCVIYRDGNHFSGLDVSRKTGLGVRYFFFHNGCATCFDGRMYAVLTPRSAGEQAVLSCDGELRRLDFDGYLTGVALSVLPAEDP